MSGDVQPRKRKDKKKKKDDLGVEEPRGTAAALGEGDLFLHSHQDHGTGGHWCAKVIFFSLLAVLITLIGLIILENRGLSELEANSVESRYSGVLEGWLEDAADDDHHDAHTLELKHHDDDDDDHGDVYEHHHIDHDDDEDEEHHSLDDNDEDEEHDDDGDDDDDHYDDDDDDDHDDEDEHADNEDDDDDEQDDEHQEESDANDDGEEENYQQNQNVETADDEDEDDHDEHDDDDDDEEDNVEVERIEREVSEEEPISLELPALAEDDDDDKGQDQEEEDEKQGDDDDDNDADDGDKDDVFLETDDDDEPPIERITAPSGRPFDEVEDDDVSTEKPPDTLEEEEEYEKKQEELRKEQEQQSSHMWLKLVVGVALLAATHAVVRRATAPSDETESDEHVTRQATPVIDRRMTLIPVPEEPSEPEVTQKASKPVHQEIVKKTSPVVKTAPPPKEESEEEEEDQEVEEIEMEEQENDDEKELFSEEEPEDEPEEEKEIVQARKETPKQAIPAVHEPTPDDDVGDDVEIIDDEEIEDDEEEEISDVDDAELLTRLEAKYGRLPEPDRPGPKHKDGGNSLEDEWPGEPSDPLWRQQLDSAERDLRQGEYLAVARLAGAPQLANSGRARWILARALDTEAEARRDNNVLTRAIAAYIHLLKLNERLSDKKLLEIANRTLERIQFRGNYLSAEPVYRLLIRRFPDDVTYRNKLTVSYLMANRQDLADQTLKETLRIWPNDRVALAQYGFVLKTEYNKLEEAVVAFQKALEGDQGPACEPRFYYHYGDALLLLGRFAEANEIHKRGAKHGHFLSPAQRSLYNVPRLTGKPWWNVEDTPYVKLARALEKSWREILKEGLAAEALYEKEKEGLKERGEWSQLDLFVRGREIPGRCARAPVACSIVRAEAAAAGCRRGQVKFSAMAAGTHVRPHVGPTNCRLRMHLGLSNTKDTYLRVDQETRQWQEGKVLLFDDSFEHEVWHNGTGRRLVLIVDVWHPDLTPAERRQLPAI